MVTFTEPDDYSGPTRIKIPARKSIVSICIRARHDHIFEKNESFIVFANFYSNDIVDSTDCTTTVTIMEDSEFIFLF